MRDRRRVLALVVPLAWVAAWVISTAGSATGGDEPGRQEVAPADGAERPAERGAVTWTTAMEPRPLSRPVRRGLEWLVESQLPGGGWGAGEVSRAVDLNIRSETPELVGTCMACLALIRSGSTPREGPYRGAIAQGVEYVCTQLESFDPEALAATNVGYNTMSQRRIGPYLDTYLACMLLAEVKGHMSSSASEAVVDRTLKKVIGQIEQHVMQEDPFGFPAWTRALSESVTKGTPLPPVPYDLAGWEWILAGATCGKGLNRARQAGAVVSDFVVARVEDGTRKAYKDLSGVTPPIEPSNWVKVWRFAREIVQARFRQQVRDRALSLDGRRVESDSRLAGAGPVPPSRSGGEAAMDGESPDGEMEARASKTVPQRSRTKGRTTTKGLTPTRKVAGGGLSMPHAVSPGVMLTIWKSGGAELYSRAATLGLLQDLVNTGRAEMPRLRDQAAHSKDAKERAAAEKSLARIAESEKLQQEAQAAVIARLGHRGFLDGLGTIGGDEFLSYMMIAESLAVKGGDAWRRWDSPMTASLARMQNGDGSWTGAHYISGRTFCTAAALLTLMADRTPIPVPAGAKASSAQAR